MANTITANSVEEAQLVVSQLPSYLFCMDDAMREEARRIFILNWLTDENGVLIKNWKSELPFILDYIREGKLPAAASPKLGVIS